MTIERIAEIHEELEDAFETFRTRRAEGDRLRALAKAGDQDALRQLFLRMSPEDQAWYRKTFTRATWLPPESAA